MSGQTVRSSSKITLPNSRPLASTLRGPTVKAAPVRQRGGKAFRASSARVASTIKSTSSPSKSTWYIDPVKWASAPLAYTVSLKTVLRFFHISNLENTSLDEDIYLHTLYSQLVTQARLLAAIWPWPVQRPLQALRAAMSGPGKNYSVRSGFLILDFARFAIPLRASRVKALGLARPRRGHPEGLRFFQAGRGIWRGAPLNST